MTRDDKLDKKKHEQETKLKLTRHYRNVPLIKVFLNHHYLLQ